MKKEFLAIFILFFAMKVGGQISSPDPKNILKSTNLTGAQQGTCVALVDKIPEKGGSTFSLKKFGENIHSVLSKVSLGHTYAIFYDGGLKAWGHNGYARRPGVKDPFLMNAMNTRINVASSAKSMTAIALIKVLNQAGVSLDAPMSNFLPSWWTKGPNIHLITFRHLLTHKSGFLKDAEKTEDIRKVISEGVSSENIGKSGNYRNLNFCIMRLLIPALAGDFDYYYNSGANPKPGELQFNASQDVDKITQLAFMKYMQKNIWDPFLIKGTCENEDGVLYYNFSNPSSPGINTSAGGSQGCNGGDGKECSNAGGGTISISTMGLANVMYHARFTNKLLNEQQRNEMFNSSNPLGCYIINSCGTKDYMGQFHHNGGFSYEPCKKGGSACWYTFHNGVAVAVATNSPITSTDLQKLYPDMKSNSNCLNVNFIIEKAFDLSFD